MPQELYALINYGEMRRKLPFMHEKAFMKLKELVYRGSVTIREKGKAVRIRTPSCRALKKLNQLEGEVIPIKIPPNLTLINPCLSQNGRRRLRCRSGSRSTSFRPQWSRGVGFRTWHRIRALKRRCPCTSASRACSSSSRTSGGPRRCDW